MRRLILILFIILSVIYPVKALEFLAPEVPAESRRIMPNATDSFEDGIRELLSNALNLVKPDVFDAWKTCILLTGCTFLVGIFQIAGSKMTQLSHMIGALTIGGAVLMDSKAMIYLGADAVETIADYGKLLLPVMTGALAAQGAPASSAALYAGTAFFSALLSDAISKLLIPGVTLFLVLATAQCSFDEPILKRLKDVIKNITSWILKTTLSVFMAYIGITGVVSGTTDAAALKATKLAFSSFIPVVGGILSDASEAVLVGVSLAKNAAGIYGMFALLSILAEPFLRIGMQYLMLKLTGFLCSVYASKQISELIGDYSSAMGLLLGMVASVCLLLLIGTVCFMKGLA